MTTIHMSIFQQIRPKIVYDNTKREKKFTCAENFSNLGRFVSTPLKKIQEVCRTATNMLPFYIKLQPVIGR